MEENMIFLGCLYDEKYFEEYRKLSRVGLQNAANSFQWAIIRGLEDNHEHVCIYNILPVGNYPNAYKQLFIPSRKWNHKDSKSQLYDYEIGCINVPIIKQLIRGIRLRRLLKKSLETKILIYSTDFSLLFAVHGLPRNISISLIVTDLPEFYDLQKKKSLLRLIYNKLVYKYFTRIDNFVLLTKAMETRLPISGRKSIVMEGLIDYSSDDINFVSIRKTFKENDILLLYTGTLSSAYGIGNLVNAVKYLENNYKLIVCGRGELESDIRQLAKTDNRFIYYGQLPRSEVMAIQKKVDILINPRTAEGEYTNYSFPSKTLEYLLSGTPLLMFKLPGIPNEYDDFITYFKSSDPFSMAKDICDTYSNQESHLKANRAREFIINYKNAKVQTRKILDLMEL